MGHRPNPYFVMEEKGLTAHKSTPKVTMGAGALEQLGNYTEGKIAIVLDTYLLQSEVCERLTKEILAGRDYRVICDVKEEPSYEAIDPFIPVIREYAPRYIVAIGGGSTMDTAKALWMFYECPQLTWEDTAKKLPPFEGRATLIAVPTTSGTGAEATGAAVYKKYDGSKALVIDEAIRPGEAFLDYSLLGSIPPKVVVNAGVDALAHVVGALSCEACNLLDHMICTQTAVSILKALPKSYRGDGQARALMHVCAYLAGDEINNAGGGLDHKLDMFAKAYHLPHGQVIGIFLPYTMLYLIRENHYLDIAEQMGMPGESAYDKQRNLIEHIWNLYDEVGMPKTLKETGIPEEEFLAAIPSYIEMVKEIGHIYWIRGYQGDETLKDLYRQAYYGLTE
ncbi:MAG: iron-containing alcohol dehydrogenase [Lachnospiraceae bacterium]|nr:iron-containing alcohol dehydrogenase [Lachnospiraceae bacterium]